MEDPRFRDKVSRVEIELMALEITNLRFLDQMRGGRPRAPEVSLLKIRGTEIQQALTELMMQARARSRSPSAGRPFDDSTRSRRPRAALLQLPQDLDLRGLERDPAQHHRQDEPRAMNFDYNEEQRLLAESVTRFVAQDYASRAAPHRRFARGLQPEGVGHDGGPGPLCASPLARPWRLRRRRGGHDEHDGGDRRGARVEPYLATIGLGARLIALAGYAGADRRSCLRSPKAR
jgi:alkylation response protein AidB-like acyl-CoA dehydrogenase